MTIKKTFITLPIAGAVLASAVFTGSHVVSGGNGFEAVLPAGADSATAREETSDRAAVVARATMRPGVTPGAVSPTPATADRGSVRGPVQRDVTIEELMAAHPGADAVRTAPVRTDDGGMILGELAVDDGRDGPGGADSFAIGGSRAASPAGHSASNDMKAGPGCAVQCITSGVAYAYGVGATLEVTTDTPARTWIIVWDDDGYHRMVDSGDAGVMSFKHTFDDLEAGSTYQAMAVAEDSQGFVSHGYGSFDTLTRHVEVSFMHAEVLETPYGKEPMRMSYRLDGEWYGDDVPHPFLDESDALYSPTWLGLGIHAVQLGDVDQHLDFMVQLRQRDPGPSICEGMLFPVESPLNGTNSSACVTWATAVLGEGMNDLDAGLADAPNATTHTLHRSLQLPGGALPGGYGEPLNFSVPVTLQVTYEE